MSKDTQSNINKNKNTVVPIEYYDITMVPLYVYNSVIFLASCFMYCKFMNDSPNVKYSVV